MSWNRGGWAPYVSAAERRLKAAQTIAKMTKKGEKVSPVVIDGRVITKTFWGKAWCDNLESYMDYENRLPRGRTYVRNGSVLDLQIKPGQISALVNGSSLYKVEINILPVESNRWQGVIKNCTGKINSVVELLQGKLSQGVMETVTSRDSGLFPNPKQISLKCSCPDWASMCKHVAAALYGVGSRLDQEPEVLFLLRQVDYKELIAKASTSTAIDKMRGAKEKVLETADLSSMFGIEIEASRIVKSQPVKTSGVKLKTPARKKISKKSRKTKKVHGKKNAKKTVKKVKRV